MNTLKPQPGIMDIAPYQGGEGKVAGVDHVIKLSSNENPFGSSPAAQAAVRDAAADLNRYPSSDHFALRQAIASRFDLDADKIICGAGSDEIISFLCQAFAGPGDEVLYTRHGFAMYKISGLAAGATPVEVAETNRTTDVDALIAGCTDRTRLVFIANPNNPTGTMIDPTELTRLADGIPDHALLVLDGAYAEYVPGYDGGASLVETHPNVVMTRTFSKLYGLGGLRIGWAYADLSVIDVLNRVRGPFNVSGAALAAAQASLEDQNWQDMSLRENARLRDMLAKGLAAAGVPSDESHANFILAQFNSPEQAAACDTSLREKGLITRGVSGYNLPNCLRITVGDEPSCLRVIEAVTEFMETA